MATEVPNIGRILPTNESIGRDAVHVAIVPVIAAETLQPGQRVGLIYQGADVVGTNGLIASCGIVDPYLTDPVRKGQRFYLFLYPGTVTSLRHEWTHPLFDGKDKP